MADRPPRSRSLTDSFGQEIERLIGQLPHADPRLLGDPDPPQPPARASRGFETIPYTPSLPAGPYASSAGIASPTRSSTPPAAPSSGTRRAVQWDAWGVWLRTFAALGLGVAVAFWPYARDCGWMLHGYLAVIGAVLVVGSWASQSAWRAHSATAHLIGLLVVYWGVVLAAEQVLPRIGYAAVDAAWRCTS
jgi:hypothetical protein